MMKKGVRVEILVGSYAGMVGEIIRVVENLGLYEVWFGVNRGRGYIGSWIYEASGFRVVG